MPLSGMSVRRVMHSPSGSGATTSAQADGDDNTRLYPSQASICYVGVEFNTSDTEYEDLNGSGTFSSSQGSWLSSGSSSGVWVSFHRTGGSKSKWTNHTNADASGIPRYNLGTTQRFYITDTDTSFVAATITGYFRFWDVASGGTPIQTTSTVTWTARLDPEL